MGGGRKGVLGTIGAPGMIPVSPKLGERTARQRAHHPLFPVIAQLETGAATAQRAKAMANFR